MDPSASDLEKLTDFNGDLASSLWGFRPIGREGEDKIYEVSLPNEEIVDMADGLRHFPISATKGPPFTIRLKLTGQGELTLYQPSEKIYLSEVSEAKASELRDAAARWSLQRAYFW